MTELTDLSDTDALNTAVTGQSTEGNVANMGSMDNLQQAILGMLSRFRNDNVFRLRDNSDNTKLLAYDLAGLPTATTRTVYAPRLDGAMAIAGPREPGGRLTFTSNTPIMTSNVTAATSLYYAPFRGNRVNLYDGTRWVEHAFSQITLSLAGLTANALFDIFLYDNAGTLTLEAVSWTSSGFGTSSRATALVMQDGLYCKTGALTRLYLGTILMTGTIGQSEWTPVNTGSGGGNCKLYLWNAFNRVPVACRSTDTATSWSYNSATPRFLNNSGSNGFFMVQGLAEHAVSANVRQYIDTNTGNSIKLGFGVNSSSSMTTGAQGPGLGVVGTANCNLDYLPALGASYLVALEAMIGAGTYTAYGTDTYQSLQATIWA